MAIRSAQRWATSSGSSRRTTAKWGAVKPCLREFCAERALPSGVRGPVEWDALARFAANCFSETGFRDFDMESLVQRSSTGKSLTLRVSQPSGGKESDDFVGKLVIDGGGFQRIAVEFRPAGPVRGLGRTRTVVNGPHSQSWVREQILRT